jgi:hypothetical protein
MISRNSLLHRTLAIVLACAVMQLYVMAGPAVSAKTGAPASPFVGMLKLQGNQSILVNGNNAVSGTTIFSGSQLQTPEGVQGTVQLGEAGSLHISPNTSLTLTFDNQNVDVQVASGHAFLTTKPGVKGNVVTPDGKTTAAGTQPAPAPQTGTGPGSGRLAGVILVVVFVTVAAVVYYTNRDDNES